MALSSEAKKWAIDHLPPGLDAAFDLVYNQVEITKAQLNAITSTAITLLAAVTNVLLVPLWVHAEKPDGTAYTANGLTALEVKNGSLVLGSITAAFLTSAPPRHAFQAVLATAAGAAPASFVTADFGVAIKIQGTGGDPTGGTNSAFVTIVAAKVPKAHGDIFTYPVS